MLRKTISGTILIIFFMYGKNVQAGNNDPYSESEIVLKTSTGNIYGTLTIAENTEKSPLVLIIAGSGPTDRNGNSTLGIHTNAYKMLAESLAEKGISTLRFDKRGIGESKDAMVSEDDLKFETYVKDVVDWVSLLRKDPRFFEIILLGHSEGSLIGMIAAEQTPVDAFISVAGAGRPIDILLKEQLKTKLPPDLLAESNQIIDSLKAGKTVSNVSKDLYSIFRPSIQPFMISWIKYDPAKEISKLNIPVLIIQGTTDLQVPVNDAILLSESKPDAKLLIIANMNHILKEAPDDIQKNTATYFNPDLSLKQGLTDAIVHFILTGK